jgi:hypothetical protein
MGSLTRRRGPALACALFLALAVGPGQSIPSASPPSSPGLSACARFLPLPPSNASAVHQPPTPDLPPPSPRRERSFHHAVHTLFLDKAVARLAAGAGFDTVVQVFPWRDLNPYPGLYAWEASDYMVRMARTYGLELVIRLDMPPAWAVVREANGLPFDLVAYADFVSAVAARYRGHVLGYIIWNEPNLAAEWSRSRQEGAERGILSEEWVADPADYVGLLGVAFDRIRAADPQALVVAAGLAPTNEISPRALDDRPFLRGMYAAGANDCFDVLGIHDYGYGLSPEDERGAHGGLNLARILDLHEIMQKHDAAKPVWITELGYTVQTGRHPSVGEEDQASYLTGAFKRVKQEWPWVDMLAVWNLCYGRPPGDEMSGYSLVEPDLRPRQAYRALQEMIGQTTIVERTAGARPVGPRRGPRFPGGGGG